VVQVTVPLELLVDVELLVEDVELLDDELVLLDELPDAPQRSGYWLLGSAPPGAATQV
jgi:hypothetical protein